MSAMMRKRDPIRMQSFVAETICTNLSLLTISRFSTKTDSLVREVHEITIQFFAPM